MSARITRVEPVIFDENGFSSVGAMTCFPRRFREAFDAQVGDLFRCFVDLDEAVPVDVHLNWLAADPAPVD